MGKEIAKGINNGNIKFFDKHLSMFPVDLMYGFYTMHKEKNRIDIAIIEASAITEDGGIIPGASVGGKFKFKPVAQLILQFSEIRSFAQEFSELESSKGIVRNTSSVTLAMKWND